jgi:hypothetical protein
LPIPIAYIVRGNSEHEDPCGKCGFTTLRGWVIKALFQARPITRHTIQLAYDFLLWLMVMSQIGGCVSSLVIAAGG